MSHAELAPERPEFVVMSDVHLTEIVDDRAPGWWAYKAPEVSQDEVLCDFLSALASQRPEAFTHTELIFNGDTFDFDSVHSAPPGERAPRQGLPSHPRGSLYKMRRLIGDHPRFVRGLARFLSLGNRVTFVMGNHDRELCFAVVQRELVAAVSAAAPAARSAEVAARIRFEPWFVYVPGALYVEHGQQYDATCSYRDVLYPVLPATENQPEELEMSFGSVIGRRVLSRIGTFNPYNDESFLMSIWGYLRHMWRYYFPCRGFFRPYFGAAVGTLVHYWRQRRRPRRPLMDQDAYAASKGVSSRFVQLLRRLTSRPVSDTTFQLIHELWLDRFLAVVLVLSSLVLGFVKVENLGQGLAMVSLIPVLFLLLRSMGRGSLALQERGRWGLVAEQIADGLPVPLVVFGHSHRPERRRLSNGGFYFNLGSWAPLLPDDGATTLARARRFLVVRPAADGRLRVAFQRWNDGAATDY